MLRILLIALLYLPLFGTYAQDTKDTSSANKNICLESPQEVYTKKELFEASWYSTILLKLLSGKSDEAKKQLGQELSWKILILNETLVKNPCKVSEATLKKIPSFFRLIAAINTNYPITELKENKEVQKALSVAIKDNPTHYQQLLDTYK